MSAREGRYAMQTFAGLMWWWLGLGLGSFAVYYVAMRPFNLLAGPMVKEEVRRGMSYKAAIRLADQRYANVWTARPKRKLLGKVTGWTTFALEVLFVLSLFARIYLWFTA